MKTAGSHIETNNQHQVQSYEDSDTGLSPSPPNIAVLSAELVAFHGDRGDCSPHPACCSVTVLDRPMMASAACSAND